MNHFHDVAFPIDIALGSKGGPQRATDVMLLGSGREERNARWAHSRRRYDAGTGLKSLADLARLVAFFEARGGRLHGFRWRDPLDDRSCAPAATPGPLDQPIGTGDGHSCSFALSKTYGEGEQAYVRPITKPVEGSLHIAVNGIEVAASCWSLDALSGRVTLATDHAPPVGAAITAGFLFDVPVRFDTDEIRIDHSAFAAGTVASIPLIEIRE